MNGNGWIAKTAADLGIVINFVPWDIDYDSKGRIYFVNNGGSTDEGVVFRLDSITDSTAESYISLGLSNYTALTIDRPNDWLYYTDGFELYRKKIDTTQSQEILNLQDSEIGSLRSIHALAVDENGYVYILNHSSGYQKLIKINPDEPPGSRMIGSYSSLIVGFQDWLPMGLLVKPNGVYIANNGASDRYLILKLDSSLSFLDSFGTWDQFYDPTRFIGTVNEGIYVCSEDLGGGGYDKIVYFEDMSGSGFNVYGAQGSGVNQFLLFSSGF